MEHFFIDENVEILEGEEAARALARHNDSAFFVQGQGVPRVTEDRWCNAQAAEKRHWLELGVAADDDRNYQHLKAFQGYRVLRDREFKRAIELGCGPFTNLRIIGDICRVTSCDLLDPLIREYIGHPNCSYRNGHIRVENTSWPRFSRLVRTGVRRLTTHGGKPIAWPLRHRPTIPVARIMPIPIEKLVSGPQYDLVTMINVVEHCYDIDLVLRNVAAATAPDGILIFHDKYYSALMTEQRVASQYDAAHPLRVDRSLIDGFLSQNYSSLFHRVVPVAKEFMGCDVSSDHFYFIGRRL